MSVGLAVYNGERYLGEAIESILSQTFTDLELIISDNASTDGTECICRRYAEQDRRIRYSRNQQNIGGANNENLTFELSRAGYFRWAAHDDVCDPRLLQRCVAVLDSRPDVVLVHSRLMKIDANGTELGVLDQNKASSPRAADRFRDLTAWDHDCEATYGLMRASVLRRVGLQRNYTDSDRTLLAGLSLYGQFYQLPEVLFFKRYHPAMSTQVFSDYRSRMAWFGDEYAGRASMPYWSQFFHYLELIWRSPASIHDRAVCYAHMMSWLVREKRWGRMANDLVLAARRTWKQERRSKGEV